MSELQSPFEERRTKLIDARLSDWPSGRPSRIIGSNTANRVESYGFKQWLQNGYRARKTEPSRHPVLDFVSCHPSSILLFAMIFNPCRFQSKLSANQNDCQTLLQFPTHLHIALPERVFPPYSRKKNKFPSSLFFSTCSRESAIALVDRKNKIEQITFIFSE